MRRVVGVLLVTAMVPGLAACSKKKVQSEATVAAWFRAAEAHNKAAANAPTTTTTTPARATTTIPATTSTLAPLIRLAQSKAFQDAADARRQAEQRCLQLAAGKQNPCAVTPVTPPPTSGSKSKAKAKPKPQSPTSTLPS